MNRIFGVGAVFVVFGTIVACGSEDDGRKINLPPRGEPTQVAEEPKEEPKAEEPPPFEPVLCNEQEASFEAKRPKSNILFLLDRSGSMQIKLPNGETRWTATRDALFKMIDGLPKADARASVMQFPQGDATVNTCCAINASNQVDCNCTAYPTPAKRCDATTYKAPAPMDLDATNIAAIKKTVNASNTSFYWGTPLAAAEQAGVNLQKASQNDGIKSVILLTDGAPTSCDTTADPTANDPKLIVDAAKGGLNDKIRTFVIGVVDGKNGNDARPDVLEQVATAGGTSKFFSVSAANLQMELGKALEQITREATDCTFDLPAATDTTDLEKVNVTLTTAAGTETIARDQAQAEGWDFQDGQTRVKLFGTACTKLQAEAASSVKVVLGCKTVTN